MASQIWLGVIASRNSLFVELTGTVLIQLFCFWLPGLFYLSLDRAFPAFSTAHKIQPTQPPPTTTETRHCILVVLRNQVIGLFVQAVLITIFPLPQLPIPQHLPTPRKFFKDIFFSVILCELIFFYVHRLLHTRKIYSRVHHIHHAFTAPIALSAHFWVFSAMVALESCSVHSGYAVWSMEGLARRHDWHHQRVIVNFGTFWVLDWAHGTDGGVGRNRKGGKGGRGGGIIRK